MTSLPLPTDCRKRPGLAETFLLVLGGFLTLAAVAAPTGTAHAADEPQAASPDDAKVDAKAAAEANIQLATEARDLLKRYCYECHGSKQLTKELNVALYRTVVDPTNKYFVPKNLEDSEAWQAIESKRMPKDGSPKPTKAEMAVIREWIEKGAAAWPLTVQERPFVTEVDTLEAIRDDLRKTDSSNRRFFRYFSLANLHNNWQIERRGSSEPVEADVLNLARAALSKACNSMTWESRITIPVVVDKNATVLRIDLRDLGWDKGDKWRSLLQSYPYGLKQNLNREQKVRDVATEVVELSGSELPCIRLDWFLDTATRPKIYKIMLELPAKVQDIEKKLNVDVESDFLRDRLMRAGFAESGVSRSNRLVDRHSSAFGAYWKSYDFGRSEGKGNLFSAPLGPKFAANPFDRGNDKDPVFQHDGGEMIFNLPNGLQGYYLSKANGDELEEGPINVVRDSGETGGTPSVLNGLSCMACHAAGVRRFTDTLRAGTSVEGDARLKVDRLVPTQDKMDEILDQDEARFLKAAAQAMGPFLNPADPKSVTGAVAKNYKEPIGLMAKMYQKDLSLEEAAFELGFKDAGTLKTLIEGNSRLRQLGLTPLANGAAIKREAWTATKGISIFQKIASELDRGTPHREL